MQDTQSKSKGLPAAQIAKASELVNYQEGFVVSREIVKKPTGNVTVFAFDEGQGLSEHTAPFDAVRADFRPCGSLHRLMCRNIWRLGRPPTATDQRSGAKNE